jgi:hypothetical protein
MGLNGLCEWNLVFGSSSSGGGGLGSRDKRLGIQNGIYTLETTVMWINESEEPDGHVRSRDKDSRVNDGNVIHLGGLGTHPYHSVNASSKYHNFTGYLLQGHSRSVHLITGSAEKRSFGSFDCLLELGYGEIEIFRVPETFLGEFTTGSDLSVNDKSVSELVMNTRALHKKSGAKELIAKINEHVVLYLDSISRAEAFIFNLPKLEINELASVNQNSVLGSCQGTGANVFGVNNMMDGRWVQETSCDEFAKGGNPSYETTPVGHVCMHALPVYSKGVPWQYDKRNKNMVWKPYNCNLRQFLLNEKEHENEDTIPSSLAHSLRSAGVGMLAGFGDSLGDEQRDNILGMMGRNVYALLYFLIIVNYIKPLHHALR